VTGKKEKKKRRVKKKKPCNGASVEEGLSRNPTLPTQNPPSFHYPARWQQLMDVVSASLPEKELLN